jgi:hypothetical protein
VIVENLQSPFEIVARFSKRCLNFLRLFNRRLQLFEKLLIEVEIAQELLQSRFEIFGALPIEVRICCMPPSQN